MTDTERREAARRFCNKWMNRGNEDEDGRSFWIEFLQNVLGVTNVTDRIEFEKKVIGEDGNTKRIDAYIPETKVLIEQKSHTIDLSKPQPGHKGRTPYEQAKSYDDVLPLSEKAKWIIVSNFKEIWVYDMDTRKPEPQKFSLDEIQTKFGQFEFLVNKTEKRITQEIEVSQEAGKYVGLIYDALLKQYIDPESEETLKSLNMLCVRLVFCLYAEDAHIFGTNGHMFHDYMEQFETVQMRKALIELFKILNTPEGNRDPYETGLLSQFPYVNGGLFADENVVIPNFTDEIKDAIFKSSENFDWSVISPTIFGAVFESTLNPETRRKGGMHYTSIENIHKVIDPLFFDEMKEKFDAIIYDTSLKPEYTAEERKRLDELMREEMAVRGTGNNTALARIQAETRAIKSRRTRKSNLNINQQILALDRLQDELAELTFLDPACGSGNFLTETYLSLRRLENDILRLKSELRGGLTTSNEIGGQIGMLGAMNPIKVSIEQFYGIEINDFAVTVAKTALWIAESQMMKETEDILSMHLDFLPLKTNAHIIEENALRVDWEDIISKEKCRYIMGNPPFLGARLKSKSQKEDLISVFGQDWKHVGDMDYVCCWYKKASDYMKSTEIKTALVSTNSVSQGETVANLWKPLFESGVHIDFAHRTFRWDSEAKIKAHVHCVIIGFSTSMNKKPKELYDSNYLQIVNNINGYLVDADNVFIEKRNSPLFDVPELITGCQRLDDDNFMFTDYEKEKFIAKEPLSAKYFYKWYGAAEFINNKSRWCLYLGQVSPADLNKMPYVKEIVLKVKEYRLKSDRAQTKKYADYPTKFYLEVIPTSNYIAVPVVSSERRRYIPMGFLDTNVLCSNQLNMIPNAGMYHLGVLSSNVHMAWVRAVCGRLKSDYRYSKDIVYNNFPWPSPTDEQKEKIKQTAQGILDARALFPDSSLADLYDPLTMPKELSDAHTANDRAVMQAYGFNIKGMSEADCVAELMKMYKSLTENFNE